MSFVPCLRCNATVEKSESHRKTVLYELNAEMVRVAERVARMTRFYDDILPTMHNLSQSSPAAVIDALQKTVNVKWCDYHDAGGSLAIIIEDYQVATRENLEAIAYRELCTRHGMTVPHEDY